MKCFTIFLIFSEVLTLFFATSDAESQITFGNGIFNVTWNYLSASQEIEFEVRVKTTGYVALGLTKINSGMQNLDLFVGGVTSGGAKYLKDYYVSGQNAPPEDSQQDYTLLNAIESNGETMVRCKRRINTQDVKDLQIQPGDKVYFAWAYHTGSDTLTYHSARGYSPQMHELVPVPQTTTSSPTTAPTTAPLSIVYNKELAFKNGDFRVFWKFDSKTNELFFKLVVKAAGWVGLGFSQQNSAMTNLDIVVAGVSGGKGYINDYYSSSQGTPPKDSTQNYILLSAVENAGTTTVEFKRSINTGDDKDLQIAPGTSYYLAWGYHSSSDALSYHDARGYSAQKIVLVEAVPSSSPPSIATMTTSIMSTFTTSTPVTTSAMTSSMATTSTTSTMITPMMTASAMTSSMATTSTMITPMMTASAMTSSMATTSTMMASSSMVTTSTMMPSSTMATAAMETTSSMTTTSVITPSSTRVVSTMVTPTTTPQTTEQAFKNGDYLVSWKFDSNTSELFFKLVVNATGWVGLGISNINSDMKDLDVVVAGVSGGQGYIGDYYATTKSIPPQDSTQDYRLLSANESGGTTTVEFKRKLDTGDVKDQHIKAGESYYIAWAYHSSSDRGQSFSYHGSLNRGYSKQKIVLVAADVASTAPPPSTNSTTQKPVPITAATMTEYSLMLIIILPFFAQFFVY